MCNDCITGIEPNNKACKYCGRPWSEAGICEVCRQKRPVYKNLTTPFVYGGPIRDLILGLKYSGRVDVLPFLGQAMVWALSNKINIRSLDMVVPVPTVFRKFLGRGYNPPGMLAKEIAALLDLPVEHNLLVALPGQGQKGKDRAERMKARKQAFFIRPGWQLEGERILLVDDVVTTGATVQACSELLISAGARSVNVVAAARAS